MRHSFYMVFVLAVVNYAHSQFITVGAQGNHNKAVKSKCDSSNNSALVEHFFNIIFNEFHNTPPGCVCVQMCPDQPTYCYPNGCLKRAEVNKKSEAPLPVARVSDNTKPIFFLDDKTDFINDFLDKNYVDENKAAVLPVLQKEDSNVPKNLRPDPFKDRYKVLFKYKKLPKVELKYNLGEQVKNMKSDVLKKENVDVSKTRWPMNKVNPHFNVQRVHPDSQDTSKFFMSMFLDKEVANYPPKYFKRELGTNASDDDEGLDVKAIYVVGKSDNTTYSLENLIDNLIKSSFVNNKTFNIEQNNTTAINRTNNEILHTGYTTATDTAVKSGIPEDIPYNESTKIISMNFTNENVDKNKYIKTNTETRTTNKFSEMIASLSKKIDLQNNTSLEMMRRMTTDTDLDSATSMRDDTQEKPLKEIVSIVTTENVLSSFDYNTKTTKKIRQRLARRLQNSKIN